MSSAHAKHGFIRLFVVLGLVASLPTDSRAGPAVDELTKCFERSVTQADLRQINIWNSVIRSLHPDLQGMSSVTKEHGKRIAKTGAAIFERLLTVDCRQYSVRALKTEGPVAIGSSFDQLGFIAGQALMNHPSVKAGVVETFQSIDVSKFEVLLREAKE